MTSQENGRFKAFPISRARRFEPGATWGRPMSRLSVVAGLRSVEASSTCALEHAMRARTHVAHVRSPASQQTRDSLGTIAATAGASRVSCALHVQACHRHYPGGTVEVLSFDPLHDGGLPQILAGSASALPFSRPARRSLALRPACSLSRLKRPV